MMDLEKFERDIRSNYKRKRSTDLNKKVTGLFEHINDEWKVAADALTLQELKIVGEVIINEETTALHDEVESLLAQKERIERELERKRDALQDAKYAVFEALENKAQEFPSHYQHKLHQIKLQSVDLFDLLGEMVEASIITTLEKAHDIENTIAEILKETTYQTLNEGNLSTIRIRKVISTILQSAIEVSEATPTQAEDILRGTLKGMRTGLIRAIDRFKQNLLYMPDEAKTLLIEDYQNIIEELQETDKLFIQVTNTLANQSCPTTQTLLRKISKDIHYDMEELIHISKETVGVMRENLNHFASLAIARSSKALQSERAKMAKKMGVEAWSVAKSAMSDAIKTAKNRIDKK